MTGGVPIMRPHRCWTALQVSILALLVLASNAESANSDCDGGIKVRRTQFYEADLGHSLTLPACCFCQAQNQQCPGLKTGEWILCPF
ncbi:hypothetical protein INR49_000962 [Caranx melampygus]|nr:hypothetical protein INR49_000962 [Caranx melampygus]